MWLCMTKGSVKLIMNCPKLLTIKTNIIEEKFVSKTIIVLRTCESFVCVKLGNISFVFKMHFVWLFCFANCIDTSTAIININ